MSSEKIILSCKECIWIGHDCFCDCPLPAVSHEKFREDLMGGRHRRAESCYHFETIADKRLRNASSKMLAALRSELNNLEEEIEVTDSPGSLQTLQIRADYLRETIDFAKGK